MAKTALRSPPMTATSPFGANSEPGSTKGSAPPFPVQSKKPGKAAPRNKVKNRKKQTKGKGGKGQMPKGFRR